MNIIEYYEKQFANDLYLVGDNVSHYSRYCISQTVFGTKRCAYGDDYFIDNIEFKEEFLICLTLTKLFDDVEVWDLQFFSQYKLKIKTPSINGILGTGSYSMKPISNIPLGIFWSNDSSNFLNKFKLFTDYYIEELRIYLNINYPRNGFNKTMIRYQKQMTHELDYDNECSWINWNNFNDRKIHWCLHDKMTDKEFDIFIDCLKYLEDTFKRQSEHPSGHLSKP